MKKTIIKKKYFYMMQSVKNFMKHQSGDINRS